MRSAPADALSTAGSHLCTSRTKVLRVQGPFCHLCARPEVKGQERGREHLKLLLLLTGKGKERGKGEKGKAAEFE